MSQKDYMPRDWMRRRCRRVGMARQIEAGEWQIGIWNVTRCGRSWRAVATGPGTVGDGSPQRFGSLAAAHLALTGEPMQ